MRLPTLSFPFLPFSRPPRRVPASRLATSRAFLMVVVAAADVAAHYLGQHATQTLARNNRSLQHTLAAVLDRQGESGKHDAHDDNHDTGKFLASLQTLPPDGPTGVRRVAVEARLHARRP